MNLSEELDKKLCEEEVPSGFDIYKWARENPDKAISHSIARTEKIFDESDEIFFGMSGGKDSSLTAEIAILELKRRWARVDSGINRKGENKVDPLDEKWVGKTLWGNSMDSEWIYTDTYNTISDFCKAHGPGLYEFNGKKFTGASLHETKNNGILTAREIYNKVQDGLTIEIVKHL